MKSSKTTRLILLVALLLFCLISLLGGFYPANAQEEMLRVMVWSWSPEVDEALDKALAEFKERTGVNIELIRLKPELYWERLCEDVDNRMAPDILWIHDEWMADDKGGNLIDSIWIYELDDSVEDRPEIIQNLSSELLQPFRYEGKLYGIPLGPDGDFAENAYAISSKAIGFGDDRLAFDLDLIVFLRTKIPPAPEPPPPPVPELPAAFAISNLFITSSEVDIGETVTISVLVTNTGDLTGSYVVTLKIDKVVVASKTVWLDGGASQTVTFATAKDVAGSYGIVVDGLSGSFTVTTPPTPTNWPVIGGVIGGAAVAGTTLTIRRSIKVRRRREWHEKAQEEKPPETCQPCSRHCRKIELELEPALYKITHLSLSTYNSISGERSKERQVRGEIVDRLDRAVTAHRQGEKSEKLQEQVARLAHKLLQQIIEWLHGEPAPRDVSLVGYLEGGKVTCQFILYHCKHRGNVNVWEEEDKWKATIEDKRGEPMGTLRGVDPVEAKVPERLTPELTRLLMQFIEKV